MNKSILLSSLALLLGTTAALAVPARRGLVINVEQPDGTTLQITKTGDEHAHFITTLDGVPLMRDEEGWYNYARYGVGGLAEDTRMRATEPAKRNAAARRLVSTLSLPQPLANPGLSYSSFVSKGEVPALVVLAEYTDKKFTIDNPVEYFTRQFNEPGFSSDGGTGSVRDYFVDCSYGIFKPTFEVFGPIQLKNKYKYYGQNDRWGDDMYAYKMAIEACAELHAQGVDLSRYDFNNDGVVDNVYVVYPGMGESGYGNENTVWPHSFDIRYYNPDPEEITFGNVTIDHYTCSPELSNIDYPEGIGTTIHEFSHALGLPDLYSTSSSLSTATPGDWSVLDNGCYANDSRTPVSYSMYERYALEWIEPRTLPESGDIILGPLSDGDGMIHSIGNGNEYFLIENRVLRGWDKYLPASGMLIWHVDYDKDVWDENEVNNNSRHQRVDLVEADGTSGGLSYKGDPYPGSGNVTTATLTPWSTSDPKVTIQNIQPDGDNVTFSLVKKPSAIDRIDDDECSVSADALTLTVTNRRSGAAWLTVADLTGHIVADMNVAPGATSLQLPAPGLYIVTLNGKTMKIAAH